MVLFFIKLGWKGCNKDSFIYCGFEENEVSFFEGCWAFSCVFWDHLYEGNGAMILTKLFCLSLVLTAGLSFSACGQQTGEEEKRDVDTIYVLDVSGSMVDDLTTNIEKKIDKNIGFFGSKQKNKERAVQQFLADESNRGLIESNRLYRYIRLLEREIDAHEAGHISLMLFVDGPVTLNGRLPDGYVDIYCTGKDDSKKNELKSLLDPVKYGRFANMNTQEPYRGVLYEALLEILGETHINKTCLEVMDLFDRRRALPDYKKNTKMQQIILYTDGQELEKESTFEEVIRRFKLAQKVMGGGFEYIEEYAGDEPSNPLSIKRGLRLVQEGLGRRLESQRIVLDTVFTRLTDTPLEGEVAKYNVKFSNIKEGASPTLTIRCTSVPADLIQFSSGDGHSLGIPYAGKEQVPSFTLSAHAKPGDEKATVTLDLSVDDDKFVFSNDKVKLNFVFVRPQKVAVQRRSGNVAAVERDAVVATYDVSFKDIKDGEAPELTVTCQSDPPEVIQFDDGTSSKTIRYTGESQRPAFSLKAFAKPLDEKAHVRLDFSKGAGLDLETARTMTDDFVFVPPQRVKVSRRQGNGDGQEGLVFPGDVVATYDVTYSEIKDGASPALAVTCLSDPADVLMLAQGDGQRLVIPYGRKDAPHTFSLKLADKIPTDVKAAKAVMNLSMQDGQTVLEPTQLVCEVAFRSVDVAVHFLSASGAVAGIANKLDLGRGITQPKPHLLAGSGYAEKIRITVPDRFPKEGTKVNVKMEGGIDDVLQFVQPSGLRSALVRTVETSMIGWEARPSAKPGKYKGFIVVDDENPRVTFNGGQAAVRIPVEFEMVRCDVAFSAADSSQIPDVIDFGSVKQFEVANSNSMNHVLSVSSDCELASGLVSISLEGDKAKAFCVKELGNVSAISATNKSAVVLCKSGRVCVTLDPDFVLEDNGYGTFDAKLRIKPATDGVLVNGAYVERVVNLHVVIKKTITIDRADSRKK